LSINSPRGTSDIFGEDIDYRNYVIGISRQQFKLFNYHEIITPVFEHTEVFDRGIGQGTDIVNKEMYTFKDRKGRSITLRPEGTASVVRAIIEHKLYYPATPLKLFYIENMFRYERPQKGRMREFWQVGVETIGSGNPGTDAEVIWLLNRIFKELGFRKLELLINSVGCSDCRAEYIKIFKKFLEEKIQELCPDCRERYEKNPLRIFDCKVESCGEILKNSPAIYDFICSSCREHFDSVIKGVEQLDIKYRIKKELVRGFDYYTRTIFEIVSGDLESVQNALGGGGRYDNLIAQFGGPQVPAIGFAIGLDRTVLLMKQLDLKIEGNGIDTRIFIILMDNKYSSYGLEVVRFLRDKGFSCELNYEIRSVSNQIKTAEKNGFDYIIIIGENEIRSGNLTVKNLKTFKQKNFNWKTGSSDALKNIFTDCKF
jgi:histidyl-tRNA synthetase